MNEKLSFVRLPIVLLVLFFVGKLIVGGLGGSYELGTRLFAMVPLTIHLCLVWGALGRAFKGYGVGAAMTTGILIALAAQLLIVIGTVGSYALGAATHFNDPMAIVGEDRLVGFGEALATRGFGLVVNCVIGAVAALIGYGLGKLIPSSRPVGAFSG